MEIVLAVMVLAFIGWLWEGRRPSAERYIPVVLPSEEVSDYILPLLVPNPVERKGLPPLFYQRIDGRMILSGPGFRLGIDGNTAHLIEPISVPLTPRVADRVKCLSLTIPVLVSMTGVLGEINWSAVSENIIMTQYPIRQVLPRIGDITVPHRALPRVDPLSGTVREWVVYFATEEEAIIGLMENSA